jgi:hypothetical protein
MTAAPEPAPDHTRAPAAVPTDDAAGRLLAALLAAAAVTEPAPEPALAEPAR